MSTRSENPNMCQAVLCRGELLRRLFIGLATVAGLWALQLHAGNDLAPVPSATTPRDESISAGTLRKLVEQDWLDALVCPVTTQSDAAGACDGVKNGKYGFHTGLQPNPWWQVDLGHPTAIGRIAVLNRLDYAPGLRNADRLQILTSNDGRAWTLCHDNQGHHFGGIEGAPPLLVDFPPGRLSARFVRLQIPSDQPVFFHLDEVEIFGSTGDRHNLALGKPANQSSLSQWSTAKCVAAIQYPTEACIRRARLLAADLQQAGVETRALVHRLDGVAAAVHSLPASATASDRRRLYLETRWLIRELVFTNPLLHFDRLLFVKRFCQETYPDICLNHMPWVTRPGGDICVLSNPFSPPAEDRNVRYLLNGALGPGHVHGMDLWFDASRVVFGYARARSADPPAGWLDRRTNFELRRTVEPIHLFELGMDGDGLRQLTAGQWSDLDPTYAPSDDIVFVSERCGTSLQCNEYDKDETSCNLYVMRADGSGMRRMSANKDGDYLPHTLDDGTIGYTRWEYHERSFAYIQSLWSIRPDGTGADALFKQHFAFPWALEDVRSIPNSDKLVSIAAGHHTLPAGPLVVVDMTTGINQPRGIGIVTPGVQPPEGQMGGVPVPEGGVADHRGFYSTPWPLSEKYFLVSYAYGTRPLGKPSADVDPKGYALYLVDVFGNKELIYRDPAISCFMPIPLRPRHRPPIVSGLDDAHGGPATCVVSDISHGCAGVDPAQVGFLRIAEPVGWPYDKQSGGHRYVEDHNCQQPSGVARINNESWTPIRVLGDVPVAADGSVTFQLPPDRAVYFQLLDKNRMELRRMRSFISFQPGETRACVGCHESRGAAPPCRPQATRQSLSGEPVAMIAPPWGARPISFLRDVQPVLDAHCVGCHAGLQPAGKLDFSAGLTAYDLAVPGYGYNRAYVTLMTNQLVARSPAREQDARVTMPLEYGSHKSRLIQALDDATHRSAVKLDATDRLRLTMWVDANAPYHDRFINKRAQSPVYDLAADRALHGALLAVHARRCAKCHKPDDVSRLDWIDIHEPRHSLFLTAPLADAAGGAGRCKAAPYQKIADPDYQKVLTLVRTAVQKTWSHPRRDVRSLLVPGR